MTDQFQFEPADESEQLDQLDPDPAVVDRDADDAVDDSYAPRDDLPDTETSGAEVVEGVEFEQRMEQDEPEVEDDWDEDLDDSDEPAAAP